MTNLHSIFKSRDIILPMNTHIFQVWCWKRHLRIPWTARRSNQSILKEINPKYLLEILMLKLQYFGYFMQGANSWEKTLILEKIEAKGEEDGRG